MWQDLKIAAHQQSPSNLTDLEQFYKEEWAKILGSRCTKLTETYPRRLAAYQLLTQRGEHKQQISDVFLYNKPWCLDKKYFALSNSV